MAKQVVTTITDDLDGSPDARSVVFGYDGIAYSIDLSAKNEEKLAKALAPFIAKAVRMRATAPAPARSSSPPSSRTPGRPCTVPTAP